MDDERISLAHGNGGRFMRELIEDVFARHLGNPDLDAEHSWEVNAGFDQPLAAERVLALGAVPGLSEVGRWPE